MLESPRRQGRVEATQGQTIVGHSFYDTQGFLFWKTVHPSSSLLGAKILQDFHGPFILRDFPAEKFRFKLCVFPKNLEVGIM